MCASGLDGWNIMPPFTKQTYWEIDLMMDGLRPPCHDSVLHLRHTCPESVPMQTGRFASSAELESEMRSCSGPGYWLVWAIALPEYFLH